VVRVAGYEADDDIATVALRSRAPVIVLSNDSDMFPLTVDGVEVLRPLTGGAFQSFRAADVCEKYQIPAAHLLYDFKAMVGEAGDNIPGVPGIGAKRAAELLRKFGSLDEIIHAGKGGFNKHSELVAQHERAARFALRLVSLRADAPVPPITPSSCALRKSRAA
jgi:DNA polymerase-1